VKDEKIRDIEEEVVLIFKDPLFNFIRSCLDDKFSVDTSLI